MPPPPSSGRQRSAAAWLGALQTDEGRRSQPAASAANGRAGSSSRHALMVTQQFVSSFPCRCRRLGVRGRRCRCLSLGADAETRTGETRRDERPAAVQSSPAGFDMSLGGSLAQPPGMRMSRHLHPRLGEGVGRTRGGRRRTSGMRSGGDRPGPAEKQSSSDSFAVAASLSRSAVQCSAVFARSSIDSSASAPSLPESVDVCTSTPDHTHRARRGRSQHSDRSATVGSSRAEQRRAESSASHRTAESAQPCRPCLRPRRCHSCSPRRRQWTATCGHTPRADTQTGRQTAAVSFASVRPLILCRPVVATCSCSYTAIFARRAVASIRSCSRRRSEPW